MRPNSPNSTSPDYHEQVGENLTDRQEYLRCVWENMTGITPRSSEVIGSLAAAHGLAEVLEAERQEIVNNRPESD